MKKIVVTIVGLSMVVMMAPGIAQGVTVEELEDQIADLLAEIEDLQAQVAGLTGEGVGVSCTFTRNLYPGMSGADVKCLQEYLNDAGYAVAASGAGSPGNETEYFGSLTQAAVGAWQDANGVVYGAYKGYFGPLSQTKYDALAAAAPAEEEEEEEEELEGGAGSVENYDLASGLANEEVGEDEEDVEVAGLEIEVDEGSDIKITAVQLTFDEGAAATTGDFEDYADEVSIWLESEEVARVDGDAFNDDNDWTKTVTLSGDNVIKAGETGTLYVKISGVSNLDTNDAGDTWDVDFTSIRFMDAQGATISEDPTVGATTFSFELYAAAADTNFKITRGDDEINKAHVINVDADDDTDNVDILSFNVEIEGDSDVYLDALPVNFDVTGTADEVDEVIIGLSLFMDGDEVGSANVNADCIEQNIVDDTCTDVGTDETYLFDNLDLTLEAGEDYDFVVKIDILELSATLVDGDTIAANIGETMLELAANNFDAEDESGEDLADADINGTVTGEASVIYDIGIMVELVSTNAVKSPGDPAATSPVSDSGIFTITFDVTAFDGDAYIDKSAPTEAGGTNESDLTVTGTGTVTAEITSPTGATEGTNAFLVEEDDTERFAITTNILANATGGSGFFNVALANLIYGVTTADDGDDLDYTFNLDAYKTDSLYLNEY